MPCFCSSSLLFSTAGIEREEIKKELELKKFSRFFFTLSNRHRMPFFGLFGKKKESPKPEAGR